MQKKHAHITLEEEKTTLNLCTKFSNTHLKIFPTLLKISLHFSFITLVTETVPRELVTSDPKGYHMGVYKYIS